MTVIKKAPAAAHPLGKTPKAAKAPTPAEPPTAPKAVRAEPPKLKDLLAPPPGSEVASWLQQARAGPVPGEQAVADDPFASRKFDGYLMGAGGRLGLTLADVSAVEPTEGPARGRILFVNGALSGLGEELRALQQLADATGAAVVGMHNASAGPIRDLIEALSQRHALRTPKVVKNTARVIDQELGCSPTRPVRLVGHSQGGLVISQALELVVQTLKERGLSDEEIKQQLGRIEVTTFGSAASSYPDGPRYTHVMNERDPVVSMATRDRQLRPGRGAKLVWFKDEAKDAQGPFGPHRLLTYLRHLPAEVWSAAKGAWGR